MGKIHEPAIDAEDIRVVYVVLSIGGFMGMGSSCLPCLGKPSDSRPLSTNSFQDKDRTRAGSEAAGELLAPFQKTLPLQVKVRELGASN